MKETVWAANPALKACRHTHSVHFYDDDSCLMDRLVPFIGSALGGGDSAIIIATKSHRDELERRMRALGFDASNPRFRSRYLVFDAADTLSKFMVEGAPDAASFSQIMINALATAKVASENARPQVVAFGEMVALLWAEGNAEGALQLERLWNALAHTISFSLLCAYPVAHLSGQDQAQNVSLICAEHSQVLFIPRPSAPRQ